MVEEALLDWREAGHHNSWVRWGVLVALLLAAVFFVTHALVPGAMRLTWGFSAYYTGSRLLVEGADLSQLYDEAWFRGRVVAFGITGPQTTDIWFINPPTTTLMMAPFSILTPTAARLAWTGFNLLLCLVALFLLLRSLQIRPSLTGWALLGASALAFNPLHENFRWGQAYVLLLLLHSTFLFGYLKRRPFVVGLSLGLMLVLKTYGALLLLFLLFRRRWQALGIIVGTAALIVVGSLPRFGLDVWATYVLETLPSVRVYAAIGATGYQTLSSFVHHLLSYDPMGSPRPLLNLPALATALVYGLSFLFIGLTLFFCRGSKDDHGFEALCIAALMALSVPLAPVAGETHYALLILPLIILGVEWLRSRQDARVATMGLMGYGLMAVPLPFMHPQLVSGWWSVLAYPKVYGGLLIWLALLFQISVYQRGGLRQPTYL